MLLTITHTHTHSNCSFKHLCTTQTHTRFPAHLASLFLMRRFTYSFLLSKCSQSFLTLAPYINTGHIHTHKNGSSMLTDWAGLTRSPSLAMGGNNPSPAQTHTHTLRQTLSSPLLLTDLQQCSHASPASPETLDCQQKTHTYTPNVLSVLAHTHTHT